MQIHHLTQVNRERCTAVCSVYGPTKIYVVKNRKYPHRAARAYCKNRIRESTETQSRRLREQKHLQSPNRKPRHSLSEINAEKMTAVCSMCGPTDIRKHRGKRKDNFFVCGTKKREYRREYRLSHYVLRTRKRRQSGHSLSEIDDEKKTAVCLKCDRVRIYVSEVKGKIIRRCSKASFEHAVRARQNSKQFINKYKVQHGCQRCGYNANSIALELHRRNTKEKDDKVSRLVLLGRERLLEELEKSDVLCAICHRLVHDESGLPT